MFYLLHKCVIIYHFLIIANKLMSLVKGDNIMYGRALKTKKRLAEEKKIEENVIGVHFPPGVPEIIQSYLSNQGPSCYKKLTSFPGVSFFGNKILLFAHRAAYCALYGKPDEFETIITRYPKALLYKVEITWLNVHFKASPYELLLWTDDNFLKGKENKTFLEVARAKMSCKEAEKVERNWFKDWDEKAHVKELKAAFDKVLKSYDDSKATTNDELKKDDILQTAIYDFKEYLKKLIAETRKNCIPELWNYSASFLDVIRFEDYGRAKYQSLCFDIYGEAVDKNLPPWALQVLNKGIAHVVRSKEMVPRRDLSSYYKSSNLGINAFMSIHGGLDDSAEEENGRELLLSEDDQRLVNFSLLNRR